MASPHPHRGESLPISSPDACAGPTTPSRPTSAIPDAGLMTASKPSKVLRLVARPHATIVPGMLTSKDLLARAAAKSPSKLRTSSSQLWAPKPTALFQQAGKDNGTGAAQVAAQASSETQASTDDLWELVWQPASPVKPTPTAESMAVVQAGASNKRRRTDASNCNAAPAMHSELQLLPVRRRLVGKQAKPAEWSEANRSRSRTVLPFAHTVPGSSSSRASAASRGRKRSANGTACATGPTPRGHYDVLGLPRTAEGAAVRAAYRRRALATHPDKGGDPEAFRRVVAAFEELGDESRRAAYDRTLDLFGSLDGSGGGDLSPQMQPAPAPSITPNTAEWPEDIARWWYGAARIAQCKLLAGKPESWPKQLGGMQEAEVHALLDLLRGSKILVPAQAGEGRARSPSGSLNRSQADGSTQCIERNKDGYRVVMAWANFSVASSRTPSLAQAIDWQIALAWLRATAQARLRECLGQAADPLDEEELLEALAAEPAMSLTFKATVYVASLRKNVDTPELPDLDRVLDFQHRLRNASCKNAKPFGQFKVKIDKEGAQERQRRCIAEKRLLAVALQELQKRASARTSRQARKRPASNPPSSMLFLGQDLSFKPARRVRTKSSPALLAILEAPDDSPARTRQAIASRACTWQGRPQPGTPRGFIALQERPFSSPGTPYFGPRSGAPDTPGLAPRSGAAPGTPGLTPRSGDDYPGCSPQPLSPRRLPFASPRQPFASPSANHREPCPSPMKSSLHPGLEANPQPTSPLRSSPAADRSKSRQLWPSSSPTPKTKPMVLSPAPHGLPAWAAALCTDPP